MTFYLEMFIDGRWMDFAPSNCRSKGKAKAKVIYWRQRGRKTRIKQR